MAEILLGSHVGMSGKEMFLGSVKEAAEYGANALMVYTGAPQNTRRKEIKDLNLEAGLAYADKAGIKEIVIHAPYIINLGNMEKPEMFDFGVEFLAKEVKRAAAFHSKVLVLHPGSSLSAGVEEAVEQIAKGLNLVLDADDSNVSLFGRSPAADQPRKHKHCEACCDPWCGKRLLHPCRRYRRYPACPAVPAIH